MHVHSQVVSTQPQRLVVPLFQRPYDWNEENDRKRLWNDMHRMEEKLTSQPGARQYPHFFAAVVLQQVLSANGFMQGRSIIDRTQRLGANE